MSICGPGPRTREWRAQQLGDTSLRIIALAGREGGLLSSNARTEFPGLRYITNHLSNMYDRGHLYRVRDRRVWRYFATQEAADAWGPPKEPQKPVEVPQTDWGCGFAAVGIGRDVRTGRAWGA